VCGSDFISAENVNLIMLYQSGKIIWMCRIPYVVSGEDSSGEDLLLTVPHTVTTSGVIYYGPKHVT
jgi:hypothetical protein